MHPERPDEILRSTAGSTATTGEANDALSGSFKKRIKALQKQSLQTRVLIFCNLTFCSQFDASAFVCDGYETKNDDDVLKFVCDFFCYVLYKIEKP